MELISHVYDLSNWPAPDPAALLEKALKWARLLKDVPSASLLAAHDAAAAVHSGPYPINAYEVLEGWRAVQAQRASPAGRAEWADPSRLLPAPTPDTEMVSPLVVLLRERTTQWGEHPHYLRVLHAALLLRRTHPGKTLEQYGILLSTAALNLEQPTLADVMAVLCPGEAA